MATFYGTATDCTTDVPLVSVTVTDPRKVIGQRLIRRLTTPRGGLGVVGGESAAFPEARQLAEEVFIDRDIEQHGRAPAVLGQDERMLGEADLLEERGGVRPEFGDRADILGGAQTGRPAVRHGVRLPVRVERRDDDRREGVKEA